MKKYLDAYFEMFGDIFPMHPLAYSATEDEIIDMIKECLKKKKDVYELGMIGEPKQW